MSAQTAFAGVPDDLTPEQLERWSNGLVAFLTSDKVPQTFRRWAQAQAGAIDAHMAGAADLDDEEEAPVPQRAARAPRPRQEAPRDAGVTLRVPEQTGKLLLGVVLGVLVLGAIFVVRQVGGGGGNDGDSLPTNAAAEFNQARANELTALLEQDPENKEALFELGEMNFQAGRYEDMIPSFTKLVELDPANTHALTDLGTAHYNLGQPAMAKTWWEKVLAVDPNDVQAHYNLGFMFANAEPRDIAAAVREWDEVLRLDPESQLAQTARVHIDGLKAQLAGEGTAVAVPSATQAAGATP